jgi:hypothetical protein
LRKALQQIFSDLQAVCIPDKKCHLTLFYKGNTMTYQKKQLPKYCKHKSTNRAFDHLTVAIINLKRRELLNHLH